MAYTAPTVSYCATLSGTYNALTGVQSVSISRGRAYFKDNYQITTCTVELIPATSYSPALAIGQFIDVRTSNTSSAPAYFVGKITDVSRTYGIPYNSGSGYAPADRIVITAVAATGSIAANTIGSYTMAFSNCAVQIGLLAGLSNCATAYSTEAANDSRQSNLVNVSGEGALDLANKIARTAQFVISDADGNRNSTTFYPDPTIFVYRTTNAAVTFTDTTSGGYKYNQIEFESSALTTFNDVNVFSPGVTTQTVSAATGTFNSLDYYTYAINTTDAADLAGYIYNLYNTNTTATPLKIATDTDVDDSWPPLTYLANSLGTTGDYLGAGVIIDFRGTTVLAAIQQFIVNFYVDRATLQLSLSPNLGIPFTLDSTVFGVLDSNRLGF